MSDELVERLVEGIEDAKARGQVNAINLTFGSKCAICEKAYKDRNRRSLPPLIFENLFEKQLFGTRVAYFFRKHRNTP